MNDGGQRETWFHAWMDKVTPVTVTRHTSHCVWVERENWGTGTKYVRKANRLSNDGSEGYFTTEVEANDCIIRAMKGEVERYQKQLDAAKSKLANFRNALRYHAARAAQPAGEAEG